MAISSALNPASIARERGTTAAAAQNFITGGTPLGEGIVASAANKIVGFQRGAAGVAARPPDLQGIIQTLSTSILNNVENRVQSINQNVTRIVNQNIAGLEQDYRDRLDRIDSAKPNSILQNFLNLYKEAIGYIQFLGNRRNVKTLGDNLKALQSVFAETFNIAKIIRQTIVRIVKQLSNLPQATGGGGGLNLDVNVPGGPLKRSLPGGRTGRMLKMAALGTAAVGTGALGSQVVSGMLDPTEGNVQPAPMSEGMIPGSLLDRFNSILDKFSAAINSLGAKRSAPKKSGSGAPSIAPKDDKGQKGSPPGAGGPTPDVTADTQEEKAWLQTIRKVEGTADKGGYNKLVGGEIVPELTQMTLQEVYDLGMKGKIGEGTLPQRFGGRKVKFGADSHAMGGYQFKPQTMMGVAKQLGLDPKTTLFSPEIQDKLGLKNLRGTGVDPTKRATKADIEKAGTQWAGLTPYYGQTGRTSAQSLEIYNKYYGTQSTGTISGKPPSQVVPASGQQQTAQQVAQTVSQPPPQQQTQVTVAPMNMASPQTQSRKVGDRPAPPPILNKGGVTVPFLSSSNNDNFLTLYSRIVYNIVDG